MSRAGTAALMIPPLPQRAAAGPAPATPRSAEAPARSAEADAPAAAPLDLTRLNLLPRPQRGAAAEAEETPVQPQLEVGAADDAYEQEADEVAETVMRMPRDGPALEAPPMVQAKCAACEADDAAKTPMRMPREGPALAAPPIIQAKCAACEAEEEVKRATVAEAETETGPPTLAASAPRLTGGGSALPEATRSFFEERLGRDLSKVRVHGGAEADRLNELIAARAFTYASHVWLGPGERPDTGFTMAHELAHVLQQTQPEAAGVVHGAAAEPVVRRKELRAFWLPVGAKKSALGLHTTIHNKAADALVKANAPTSGNRLIREAPIPGGNRSGSTADPGLSLTKLKGFADIYLGSTTVGVQKNVKALKSPGSNQPPVNNFLGSPKNKPKVGPSLIPFIHSTERAPKVDRNKNIADLNNAPTHIRIADVKPGHNVTERKKGVGQIGNYIAGIQDVVATTNTYLGSSGTATGTWTASVAHLDETELNLASGWDPGLAGTHPSSPKLKLHAQGQDVPVSMTKGRPKYDTGIKGSWSIARDKDNDGIWGYFLLPDQAGLDTLLADPKTDPQFAQVAKNLKEKVLDELIKPPATPAAPGVKPRRRAGRVARIPWPAGTARRKALVRRAPPKRKTAVPKAKDSFDFKAWNARRVGKGGKTPSFREDLKSTLGDPGAAVKFQREAIESLDLIQQNFGVGRTIPDRSRIEKDAKALERFEFWISPAGYVIGRLRQVFGRAFIKVWTLGERLKIWLGDKLKTFGFKGQSGAGGLKGVAMKIGVALIKTIGPILLAKTSHALVECIRIGLTRTMEELVNGPLDTLKEKIAEIERFVKEAESKLLGKIDALYDEVVAPLVAAFDRIRDEAKFIADLVGIIKDAIDLARLAICVAGGVETFGISCAVAAIDKVLSIFEISPIDKIAGAIMQSCEAQEFIGTFLATKTLLADIPQMIAAKIMQPIRDALPSDFKGLVCRDEDFKIQPFDVKELNCGASGASGGGTGEGSGEGTPQQSGKRGKGTKPGKAGGEKGTPAEGSSQTGRKLDTYRAKPVPPNMAPPKKVQTPVLLTAGMPSKDTLDPKKPLPVTLVVLRPAGTGLEPVALVRDARARFLEVGEPQGGFVKYGVVFESDFYIEELDQVFFAKPDGGSHYILPGLPPDAQATEILVPEPPATQGTPPSTPSQNPGAGATGRSGAVPAAGNGMTTANVDDAQPSPGTTTATAATGANAALPQAQGGSGTEKEGVGFDLKDARDCKTFLASESVAAPAPGASVTRLDRQPLFGEVAGAMPGKGGTASLTLYFRVGESCARLRGVSAKVLDVQEGDDGTVLDLLLEAPVHARVSLQTKVFLVRAGVWWFTPAAGLMTFYGSYQGKIRDYYEGRKP